MPLISKEYCDLNKDLHQSNPSFGTSGEKYADKVMKLARALNTQDILDYGCGKSTLAHSLPFLIQQYDPAIPKYADLPVAAKLVVCTDVLEHIEPEYLDNVLSHLHLLTLEFGYFVIATRPAKKTLADGRNAHLIVEPTNWWLKKLMRYFDIEEVAKKEGEISVLVSASEEVEEDNA